MADQPQSEASEGGRRRWGVAEAWLVGIGAGLVVVALMGAAYSIGYNKGQDDAEPAAGQAEGKGAEGKGAEGDQAAEKPEPAAAGPGKELFTQACGSCHTLADAGTSGTVGPDLDVLEPEAKTVETAIREGGAGTGAMPANIYSGNEAEQVAEYVASAAGG